MINTISLKIVCYNVAFGITLVNAPFILWHLADPTATRTLLGRVITPLNFRKMSATLTAITIVIILGGLYFHEVEIFTG